MEESLELTDIYAPEELDEMLRGAAAVAEIIAGEEADGSCARGND